MKRKSRKTAFILSAILLMVSLLFVACGDKEKEIDLTVPENVSYDGQSIVWDAVENAEKYSISINGGEAMTVTTPSYPYDAKGADLSVSVKALAGKSSESDAAEAAFKSLPSIGALTVSEDGIVSWGAVTGASGYCVSFDGAENTVNGLQFADIPAGAHAIKVKPIASDKSYYSVWSEEKSVTVLAQIPASSIDYEDGVITWKAVAGAQKYEVTVNDTVVSSDCTNSNFVYDSQKANLKVAVKAIGNHATTFNGAISAEKSFVYLDTATNVDVNDGILTWDTVENATSYSVKLNGVSQPGVTEPKFALGSGAQWTVSIKAIGTDTDEAAYFSDWSAEKTVEILPAPVVRWDNLAASGNDGIKNVVWDPVAGAQGYNVRVTKPNGEVVTPDSLGANEHGFKGETYTEIGTYKIEVQAKGGGTNTALYNSAYSLPIYVERLASPTLIEGQAIVSDAVELSKGFTVSFNKVSNASGYALYCDGEFLTNEAIKNFFTVTGLESSDWNERKLSYSISSLGSDPVEKNGAIHVVLASLPDTDTKFDITILATPTNPTMEGYSYKYDAVTGAANGYTIYKSGTPAMHTGTEYDLSGLSAGEHKISVSARGNGGNILPSGISVATTVYRLYAPENVKINTENQVAFTVPAYEQAVLSYELLIDGKGDPVAIDRGEDISSHIMETNTVINLRSVANYMLTQTNTYYMTSELSNSYTFVKLSTPTFSEDKFANGNLNWTVPANVVNGVFTPTYNVYYDPEGTQTYQPGIQGTSVSLATLEGGKSYTFYVKAIGNEKYLTSAMSLEAKIYKIATPAVVVENGSYVWSGVNGAREYQVKIDGEVVERITHDENRNEYSYKPAFDLLKTYQVEITAIGDGVENLSSTPWTYEQKTAQLVAPTITVTYDHAVGLTVTVTSDHAYATGYHYQVAGAGNDSAEKSFTASLNTTGEVRVSAYAIGGQIDETGIYYLNSTVCAEQKVIILGLTSNFTLQGSLVKWKAVNGKNGYEVSIAVNGEEFGEATVVSGESIEIPDFANVHTLTVRVKALGNGTTTFETEAAEYTWTNLNID